MMVTMSLSWRGLGTSESRGGSTGWCRASSKSTRRGASNERAHELGLIQQFPACHAYKAITANCAKNHTAICALQLTKNRFQKSRHEESANCRKRRRCRVVTLGELNQILAQWRQILFPRKNAGTQRKFRISAPHNIFEERAHAGHHFEVADHRLP